MSTIKKHLLCLCLVLAMFVAVLFNVNSLQAHAATTGKDISQFKYIGELWDDGNYAINDVTFYSLLTALTGKAETDMLDVSETLFKHDEVLTSKDLRDINNGKDLLIDLCGGLWTPTYLSLNKNNEPILTLWLEDKQKQTWTLQYSAWRSLEGEFPASLYGTSYARVEVLQNPGQYALGNNEFKQNILDCWSYYYFFAFGTFKQFLTTPELVSWQEKGQSTKALGFPNNVSNENWSNDIPDDGFSSPEMNFANIPEYNDLWKTDHIWLPSLSEIGLDEQRSGIWQLSNLQRNGIVGTANDYWETFRLRSAHPTENSVALCGRRSRTNGGIQLENFYTDVNVNAATSRACIHLNLSEIANSLKKLNFSDAVMATSNEYFNGKPIDVSFEYDGKAIDAKDYTLTITDSIGVNIKSPINVGTYNVEAVSKKSSRLFIGGQSIKTTFTILPRTLTLDMVEIEDCEWTGKEVEPLITVKIPETGVVLKDFEDYYVSIDNNINLGTATVTIGGRKNLTNNTVQTSFSIKKATNKWLTEFNQKDWRKGATPSTATTPKAKFGEAVVKYYYDANCTKKIDENFKNLDIGTYYAKVSVAGTENYSGLETIYSFRVYKLTAAQVCGIVLAVMLILSLVFGCALVGLYMLFTKKGKNKYMEN